MKMRILYILMSLFLISNSYSQDTLKVEDNTMVVYNSIEHDTIELPEYKVFKIAYEGYLKLGNRIKNEKLTIVDFNKSSKKERLWVFDLKCRKLLFKSLVCHGINSGGEFATKFSNIPGSYMSSLGFYITSNTYIGSSGLSLKLDGIDYGLNNNIKKRVIVMHPARYARIIEETGYLGRSKGCLAIPIDVSNYIINEIKDRSCIFVYNDSYLLPIPKYKKKHKKKRR